MGAALAARPEWEEPLERLAGEAQARTPREEAVLRRTSFDDRRPALRDGGSGVPSSRVDRLLRQRQMRRSMSSQGLSQALWRSSEEDLQVLYETHQTLRMSGSDQGPIRRVSPFSSTNSLLNCTGGF